MKKIKSLILIGLLSITVLTSCNDESCGCSDQDLQNYALEKFSYASVGDQFDSIYRSLVAI